MFKKIKQLIAEILITIPGIRYLFYKYYIYRVPLNEKALRGKIQYLGHCIDLDFSTNYTSTKAKKYELKYHLQTFFKRKYHVDDSVLWAVKMFLCNQYKIKPLDKNISVACESDDIRKFETIIKERRSIRKWLPEEVPDSDITKVIEWATWAPSSCNRQPWHVMVFKNESDKQELKKYFSNTFYTAAPVLLLILIDNTIFSEREKHFIYLDSGAFIQNLLLGFHVLGYGACWIGFKGWIAFNDSYLTLPQSKQFYDYFKLSKNWVPVSLIAAGRPESIPNAPARQSPQNILTSFTK